MAARASTRRTTPPACPREPTTSRSPTPRAIQLFPYDDTPNPGGVYKVWVTPINRLNCNAPGSRNCFVPRYSKTDNFKVEADRIVEIDARFYRPGSSTPMDGLAATWIDTNGASNIKYSEYNPAVLAFHEAHVEAAETGTHQMRFRDQARCAIKDVLSLRTGVTYFPRNGTVTVPVTVANHPAGSDETYFLDVHCE